MASTCTIRTATYPFVLFSTKLHHIAPLTLGTDQVCGSTVPIRLVGSITAKRPDISKDHGIKTIAATSISWKPA